MSSGTRRQRRRSTGSWIATLELLDVDKKTRKSYEGYIRNHIRPILGKLQVGKLNGETLDSFYSVLRRCRAHCGGKPFIEKHKTADTHDCAEQQCKPHVCRPLAKSSIRQVHWCLSGALKRRQMALDRNESARAGRDP